MTVRGTIRVPSTTPTGINTVELVIGGMTCAACVGRVDRKLDGVRLRSAG